MLDFTAILEAAQSLACNLELDDVLEQITQVLLQHSGGDRCTLVLPTEDEQLQVRAVATVDAVDLAAVPLTKSKKTPTKLIQHIHKTQSVVVINGLTTDLPIIDTYLSQTKPQSLLGMPLLDQDVVRSIVVLENQLAQNAFTEHRLTTLKMLCSQAAIAINNAQLYHREQQKNLQLAQSQERLQLIIQQAPVAIIEWNTDFVFQSWNPAAEKILGYCAEEAIGQPFRLIVPEEYHDYVDDVATDILTQRGGTYAVNENVTKDRGRIICEWYNASMYNDQGMVYGGISIGLDITERKKSEAAIAQKSHELEQALQELQTAQLQIIQSEKMSALGNLVSGIAHEINNPLGFISGNLQIAQDNLTELLEHLEFYKQNATPQEIQEHADNIDLEYLKTDFPNVLNSMNLGVDRIKEISTSLRIFSRQDQDYQTEFDLHDGIDSTLLILKHRTKANEQRPQIEIIKNYAEIPEVECFPGQLNQVFMNILANAVDAFDEANQGKTYQEIGEHPNTITIETLARSN